MQTPAMSPTQGIQISAVVDTGKRVALMESPSDAPAQATLYDMSGIQLGENHDEPD